jgi:crotonobetainyl-CoA:carnitine CoA-transferase CaiB-like acyl-CoA transferase
LKSPQAREILYRLVGMSDVFTEGFRPGVARKLGIEYETLRKINPRLVYCSISGYGQEGPYRDLPGHDLNYQSLSGMLQCFKDEGGNFTLPGVAIGDLSSGMFAALGILAALMAREKTGQGQYVDVSVLDGLLSWMGPRLSVFWETGRTERERDAGYGIFHGRDGLPFTLGIAHEDWFWDRLCSAVGLEECRGLGTQERRDRRKELQEKLKPVFFQRYRDDWLRIFREADIPAAPLRSFAEIDEDPQVKFREMIQRIPSPSGGEILQVGFPIRLANLPAEVRTAPPELGEHTEAILVGLGYSRNEVERWREEGVV